MLHMKFKDRVGKEIKKGDIFVYCQQSGNIPMFKYGKASGVSVASRYGRTETVLLFFGISEEWDANRKDICRVQKEAKLLVGHRALLVTRDQVPSNVLAALDSIVVP